MVHAAGKVCCLYPRHAEVLVPSKSDRQPAARCSAVNGVAPDAVLVLAGTLLPTAVQPTTKSAS
jgi:hypothetical protein